MLMNNIPPLDDLPIVTKCNMIRYLDGFTIHHTIILSIMITSENDIVMMVNEMVNGEMMRYDDMVNDVVR